MNRLLIFFWLCCQFSFGQTDTEIYNIIDATSAKRIQKDVVTLANFGTRNTFSDTISSKRGIGAARRYIKAQLDSISKECHNCLDVFYQKDLVTPKDGARIPFDTWVVNVVAIQKGTKFPDRYVIMTGDIDSRNSDPLDYKKDAPGANDNASGMAGVLEAARVLSKYSFENSIIYLGLSGEEQGLFGGKGFANYAKNKNWGIIGVLNNDMIGNIDGVDGVIDNRTFRIFSEPTPITETEKERMNRRFYGGEVDGVSRQLARYIHRVTTAYLPELNPMMVYRLDRFGRGGHHRPFNDLGYAGVRIMEAHENYNRQHQNIRVENGISYGDVISGVNFEYAKKLTTVNEVVLASLAHTSLEPKNVQIGGAVEPHVKLKWTKPNDDSIVGYKIYWRLTTAPQWENSRFVGNVDYYELKEFVVDNYYFGVASVSKNGTESLIVFPKEVLRSETSSK